MVTQNPQSSAPTPHDGPAEVIINERPVSLQDQTPTGHQLLQAAGLRPDTEYALLFWPSNGPTREIGLEEVVPLSQHASPLEFFAVKADGIQYFVLDDLRYAWAGPLTAEALRKVGRVASHQEILIECRDQPDQVLMPGQEIDLRQAGVERFYTRAKVWLLDVQGERTEWNQSLVIVRDALIKAGIDTSKPWTIILKVKGQPPQQKELNDTIDLDLPGIERLWLRPREVNNGEAPIAERRQFKLLPKDEAFLSQGDYRWETVNEGRRWLIIYDYALPQGYNIPTCTIALEIPASYPTAQIDMFYCIPHLQLATGGIPAATEHREIIDGQCFQRWSRHRPAESWSAVKDCVATQIGLIEESLGREVGA